MNMLETVSSKIVRTYFTFSKTCGPMAIPKMFRGKDDPRREKVSALKSEVRR
jgi:hypothetical protein